MLSNGGQLDNRLVKKHAPANVGARPLACAHASAHGGKLRPIASVRLGPGRSSDQSFALVLTAEGLDFQEKQAGD